MQLSASSAGYFSLATRGGIHVINVVYLQINYMLEVRIRITAPHHGKQIIQFCSKQAPNSADRLPSHPRNQEAE